ncbi:hypothetical protein ABIE48_002957 [Paenibacillus sp. OAE614]
MFSAEPRQGPGAYYLTEHFLLDAFLYPSPSRLRGKCMNWRCPSMYDLT